MNNITFSQAAVDLIDGFEGFRGSPYPDPVSHGEPITIGFGSTHYCNGVKVTMHDAPIPREQANQMVLCFLNTVVLPNFQKHITIDLTQNEIDALGSLTYNIGNVNFDMSNLLKHINSHILDGTLRPFWLTWDHAGGKVNGGLLARRAKEFNYFENGNLS